MRHVQTSPLGVARKQKVAKKPRLWRVIPLLAGLGIFVWMTLPEGVKWVKSADDAMMPMLALMGGIVLVMFGLVLVIVANIYCLALPPASRHVRRRYRRQANFRSIKTGGSVV